MRDFSYARAGSRAEALDLGQADDAAFLAGGTELINWMRIGINAPARVIDLARVEGLDAVEEIEGGVRIGALARLNDVAQNPLIAEGYPVLSHAILRAASAQIRNLATIGGNPVQRVRCPYFRANEGAPCNKREPGSGCAALNGIHDRHAIFGWTEDCVAVHPADPPVALAALDAVIVTDHPEGGRLIPVREFHVLPSQNPAWHDVLRAGELIVGIELPAPAPRSAYLKIRERESYEYATVSAAAALEMDGGVIRRARVALGSVAMRPWRLVAAEARLAGLAPDAPEVADAIDASFAEARPLSGTEWKVRLARNAARRVIELAAEA
ncbi:xanthine dehydrogenase family protein subunit M [Oceanicella sp. SM1341]|uniref:FAD binding domain-containing protein n=1 Tax=Oceanicella sp. SM1341 TaxID=1548889 RepID=UPI000E5569F9|nr:xanthine dehydrogenase family protein subunit M [Oceanicella sp. SM1341]